MSRKSHPRTATRLDLLVGKRRRDDDQANILRQDFESDKKNILEWLTPKFLSPKKMFEQADCHIPPTTLTGVGVLLGVAGATLTVLAKAPLWFAPLTALIMFTIPWLWLWNKRRTRLKKFAAQLPDALELVARALRAGHSLAAGLHVVAEEMPPPVAKEFGRGYEEQNLGIPLEEALRAITERGPN